MASLLDFLGRAATAGVGAESARLEGRRMGEERAQKDLLLRLKQEQDAAEFEQRKRLTDAQVGNYKSLADERANPTPRPPRTQVVDGQLVDLDTGTAKPLQGYVAPEKKDPTPAAGSFSQFTGPDGAPVFFNPQTRATVRVPEGLKPPSTRAGLPTEAERKAAAFYASGSKGYETLERILGGDDPTTPQVETGKGKEVPGWFAQQAAKLGMGAGNVMTNQQVRQMRQAALMLSDAWLRYTSGAAVPEQEVERFAESFIPRAGDDPGTLAQKAEARRTIIEALKRGAGRALDPSLVGTAPGMNDLDGQIDAVLRGTP